VSRYNTIDYEPAALKRVGTTRCPVSNDKCCNLQQIQIL